MIIDVSCGRVSANDCRVPAAFGVFIGIQLKLGFAGLRTHERVRNAVCAARDHAHDILSRIQAALAMFERLSAGLAEELGETPETSGVTPQSGWRTSFRAPGPRPVVRTAKILRNLASAAPP